MIVDVLTFVRKLLRSTEGTESEYSQGYHDCAGEVEEYITDLMWDNGVDDPEDD